MKGFRNPLRMLTLVRGAAFPRSYPGSYIIWILNFRNHDSTAAFSVKIFFQKTKDIKKTSGIYYMQTLQGYQCLNLLLTFDFSMSAQTPVPLAWHPNDYRPKALLCLTSLPYTTSILMSWLASEIKVQQLGFPQKGIQLSSPPWTPFLYKRAYRIAPLQSDVLRSEQYNNKPMLSPESRWHSPCFTLLLYFHLQTPSAFP